MWWHSQSLVGSKHTHASMYAYGSSKSENLYGLCSVAVILIWNSKLDSTEVMLCMLKQPCRHVAQCTRFLHFCLLFFINYAILWSNVLNARLHAKIYANSATSPSSDKKTGFSHERTQHHRFLLFFPLSLFTDHGWCWCWQQLNILFADLAICFFHGVYDAKPNSQAVTYWKLSARKTDRQKNRETLEKWAPKKRLRAAQMCRKKRRK